jgi:DNA topoisomerase-6 subunit B
VSGELSKKVTELREIAKIEAERMREANPAQYFERNLHQLGFSEPEHALLQTIKEMTDNALDAAEVGNILPEIIIEVEETKEEITLPPQAGKIRKANMYRVRVEDNGIGIVSNKIALSMGKVLFGSKLFTMKQMRGQQGVGISAVILYSQLTSLKPATVISKIEGEEKATKVVLKINVDKNEPIVLEEQKIDWNKEHGTSVEVFIPARYTDKIDKYILELSIGNPHASFILRKKIEGKKSELVINRTTEKIPPPAKEIKPHLSSVDPGILQRMAEVDKDCKTLVSFLSKHFASISPETAKKILKAAKLSYNLPPKQIKADKILEVARNIKLRRPKLEVLSNIGEEAMIAALKNRFKDAEFIAAVSRPPWTYQGIPFQVEVGVAIGGKEVANYINPKRITVIRLANKVPLPYDLSDCLLYKTVNEIDWKNYGLELNERGVPVVPTVFVTSLVASKVPYTSPGKFAVASVEEIHDELTLALQELGRKIREYTYKKRKQESIAKRYEFFRGYYEVLAEEVGLITGGGKVDVSNVLKRLFKEVRNVENVE